MKPKINRRTFVHTSVLGAAGATFFSQLPLTATAKTSADDDLNLIRPVEGYSPQIGILVSMLAWIRESVVRATANLTQEQLDFQIDDQSNSIGALLMHMAATDVIYQDLTFFNEKSGFSEANQKKWGVAMMLGDEGRKQIKGQPLSYYLNELKEVRERTFVGV